jgi:DNA-binding NarL/FixJ family response regulator
VTEYLSQGTAFATVAILSGTLHRRRSANTGLHITVIPEVVASGDRVQDVLSRRELEVLAMIAEGAPNSEVAGRLFIAETTVQSHVQHILRKLDVRNRTEAVSRYLRD